MILFHISQSVEITPDDLFLHDKKNNLIVRKNPTIVVKNASIKLRARSRAQNKQVIDPSRSSRLFSSQQKHRRSHVQFGGY